jgi:CheY-like chemotaxis protein
VIEEMPLSPHGLLTNVRSILAERAREKGLALVVSAEPLPMRLVGDPTRLQQAILNYATNAIKFTESGSITLRVLKLDEDVEAVRLRFEVADTGIGIAPDALGRLFLAFEQADNSMTRKYGGTGLGLAITKRLAGLMGGDAGVASTLGEGSTFWFTARLMKQAGTASDADDRPSDAEHGLRQRHGGRRVLVVDDEPINREVACSQLEAVGLVVDQAEDGAEAIALLQAHRYAAVIMDMQMPNINGLDATRALRKLPAHADTPVIALSANVFAEDKARCFDAGMNDFVAKPCDSRKPLRHAIALAGSRRGSRRSGHDAVEVVPAPLFAQKAALLAQAPGAAADAAKGDELDAGFVTRLGARHDLQSQPFRLRPMRQVEHRRPRRGMPGGEQVVFTAQHIGAVARAHQRLGIGRGDARMQAAAALGIGSRAPAGTGLGGLALHDSRKPGGDGSRRGGSATAGVAVDGRLDAFRAVAAEGRNVAPPHPQQDRQQAQQERCHPSRAGPGRRATMPRRHGSPRSAAPCRQNRRRATAGVSFSGVHPFQ